MRTTKLKVYKAKIYSAERGIEILKILVLFLASAFIASLNANAEQRFDYILTRAAKLQNDKQFAQSSQLLDKHIANINFSSANHQDSIEISRLLKMQGDNFYLLGISKRAAELYQQALAISKSTRDVDTEAEICNSLFKLHLNTGNNRFSKDLLSRALEIYQSRDNKPMELRILNNLGIFYYYQKDYEQSLECYEKALKLAKSDSVKSALILTNISELNVARGKLHEADRNLDQALVLIGHSYDNSDALQIWINKAKIARTLGNNSQARNLLKTITANLNLRDPNRMIESCDEISDVWLSLGDSIQGLRYLLLGKHFSDSLRVSDNEDQLRQLLVQYNSERITDRNKLLELEVRQKSLTSRVAVVISVLIVVLAIFLFYKIRSDRRKNNLINRQTHELARLRELEHQQREREMSLAIDQRNRELTSYSIDASAMGELVKNAAESLNEIRKHADTKDKQTIDEIISKFKNFTGGKLKDDFKTYFNEVHPEFFDRLKQLYPQLTPTDLRLCSYLYLGMATKEIAALTFREIRSVESSRFRLRKKLNVPSVISLHDFLQNLNA